MQRAALLVTLTLAACATTPSRAQPTARLGHVAIVDGVRVRPLAVVEDSRCPINALCVWAGRIVVRSEVQGGSWRKTLNLELGKPQQVGDGALTLLSVEPSKVAGVSTDSRAYRFTFDFQGGL